VDSYPQAARFLASQPGATYVMTIANGDGRGVLPVAGAEVRLNGKTVVEAGKITANARYLTPPVPVKAENRIEVDATGPPGSVLYIGIGPDKLAQPSNIR
jgi:hypothetical protein